MKTVNLIPIRNHLEPRRLRLSAMEEARRIERQERRGDICAIILAVIIGALCAWLTWLLI